MKIENELIEKYEKKAQGRKEYKKYLKTKEKLPPVKAILANCYCCMSFYFDGRIDCEIEDCPLYPFMPYRKEKTKVKRIMSERQKEAFEKMVRISSGARRIANKK